MYINAFGNNLVKGTGEGHIDIKVECGGKIAKIQLANIMHVPGAEGRILSLKVLAQKGFKSHISADHIHISKDNQTYAEAILVENCMKSR